MVDVLVFICFTVLNLLQDVRIVDVILDRIGDGVVSGYILVIEVWLFILSLMLFLNLFHNILSKVHLIHFLCFISLFILERLTIPKLSEGLILLVPMLFLLEFRKVIAFQLNIEGLSCIKSLMLLSLQMLVMGFVEGLTAIIVFLCVILTF